MFFISRRTSFSLQMLNPLEWCQTSCPWRIQNPLQWCVTTYSIWASILGKKRKEEEEINDSPIEQVRLTVPPTDDPTLPVLTIRTWVLGMTSCVFLAFTQQFFAYRQNQISIPTVCFDILVLAGGKWMARLLPAKLVRVPLTGGWSFSLNPGPFNIKEHVLISLLANSGGSYSEGVTVITMMKVFYKRSLQPLPSFLLVLSTALLGYGFAGMYLKFLVYSPYMWWPGTLVNVSFYRALHEPEERQNGGLTRFQFFVIVSVSSFAYYLVPSYLFPSISALSFVCWIWKDSVTAQQIGSGFHGLGVGSFALDWTTVQLFGNPMATPVFTIFNMMAGLILALYIVTPISYWTNTYNARRFPILSSNVFDADGQFYNISRILDEKTLKFNEQAYNNYSKLYFSSNFPYHYGFNFAVFTASISHTILFYGKSVWNQFRQAKNKQNEDIHTKLMKQNYEPVPQWWFYAFLFSMLGLGIFACEGFGKQLQLSYWGIILACVVVLILLLPNGILEATSGTGISVYVLLEMLMGYISPGKPIANITFKVYGLMSYAQASFFISTLKLGLYIKIPPKLMFLVQVLGSVVTCTINYFMVRLILSSVKNICHPELLPKGSPWTCPSERLEYNFGVTWGVIGPHRMFYPDGTYSGIFIFLLIGLLVPVPVWILSCIYPNKKWIKLINFPLMFGAATRIPPATAVSFWCWLVVSILFNVVVYRKYKGWWSRYNYLLGSALDAGVAFMVLLASISLNVHDIFGINWWGLSVDDHCPLAKCPTAPDIVVEGCPIIR